MAATIKTTDYTGRKVDILALDGAFNDSVFPLTQSIYSSGSKVCAGIQKLAQRWLIEFLTPLGSIPYLSDRGTDFIYKVRSGRIRTELDARLAFSFAKEKAALNLRREDVAGSFPDDEKYKEAVLLGVQVSMGSSLSLSVRIDSVAEESRVFVVPLNVVPAR